MRVKAFLVQAGFGFFTSVRITWSECRKNSAEGADSEAWAAVHASGPPEPNVY